MSSRISLRMSGNVQSLMQFPEVPFRRKVSAVPRPIQPNEEIKKVSSLKLDARNHRTWKKNTPEILFGICRRQNTAIGQTPSHMLLAWTIRRPGDWRFNQDGCQTIKARSERKDRARRNQATYKAKYATSRLVNRYQTGGRVYIEGHFQ